MCNRFETNQIKSLYHNFYNLDFNESKHSSFRHSIAVSYIILITFLDLHSFMKILLIITFPTFDEVQVLSDHPNGYFRFNNGINSSSFSPPLSESSDSVPLMNSEFYPNFLPLKKLRGGKIPSLFGLLPESLFDLVY